MAASSAAVVVLTNASAAAGSRGMATESCQGDAPLFDRESGCLCCTGAVKDVRADVRGTKASTGDKVVKPATSSSSRVVVHTTEEMPWRSSLQGFLIIGCGRFVASLSRFVTGEAGSSNTAEDEWINE